MARSLNIAIIGSGAMGLAAALRALELGHRVTVYEADKIPGGMAAHFDFEGTSIERFYHFVCKSDLDTFALLRKLGIEDRMKWVPTSMGYYIGNTLHDWGNPIALLRFPLMGLTEKFRYGLLMMTSLWRKEAGPLENVTSRDWLVKWCGQRIYDLMWKPLLHLKFYEHAGDISAAWLWTRIKRVGTSRRSMLQEELGYIDGGSETLISALVTAIREKGGDVLTGTPVEKVVVAEGSVKGVRCGEHVKGHDCVICTVPTPYVSRLVPDLPAASRAAYESIANVGVVCVILKLKRSVSRHFWVNVSDTGMEIPGFVEFSNLRPLTDTIVYVPYYMPVSREKFANTDAAFIAESFSYLQRINPSLSNDDLIAGKVGRLKHAQPVCPAGFKSTLPPVVTPIGGLQIADTCFYYPEDRGISESVRLGHQMADAAAGTVR